MGDMVHKWQPKIQRHGIYVLRIPTDTHKHKKIREALHGRKVIALKYLRRHRGHGVYRVKLLNIDGYPSELKKEFDMWGPYLCCSCDNLWAGCKCGGY